MTAIGQLGGRVKAHAGENDAPSEVAKPLVQLFVAPGPAVDLVVRFIGDLGHQRLAVDVNSGDVVAGPLVFDGLTAGAKATGALPCGVVGVADGQRGCACGLGFAGNAAMVVVAVTCAAIVIG